jgi:TatD DNase family protein
MSQKVIGNISNFFGGRPSNMKLLDIHAHLESSRFKNLNKIIEDAKKAGIRTIIQSGVNPTTNRESLKIKEKYPDIIKCSFGLYPLDVIAKDLENAQDDDMRHVEKFEIDDELKWIEQHENDCVAVGEVGLDYQVINKDEKSIELQKKAFEKIIKFAKKINKPLIIHSRKAEADVIEILEKHNFNNVIMHCFSGKKGLIKRGIENGYFFSVPPIIARLHHFENLVKLVPLTQLLTETDSPYLSPTAGEINEPANVTVTIKKISEIKDISEEEVAKAIWENASGLGLV